MPADLQRKKIKVKTKFVVLVVNGKKCTTLIYLQRFNKILVTLYIVHMGFKSFSFLFILYTDLYLRVFAGNLCFLFIGGVSFFFLFFSFL